MRYYLLLSVFLLMSVNLSAQWLTDYSYRKEITVGSSNVSGSSDLTDFPLLVNLTDSDLKSVYNGGLVFSEDGWDILFTLSDGVTLLDHEIELYTSTTGELVAWVRIPSLSYSSDTDIFIYFGNDNASADPSSTSTWDTDYRGVWHFTDGADDASQFANHGVATGTSADAGRIGDSRYFDGTNDFIDIPNTASLNFTQYVTIEAWVKPEIGEPGHSWAILVKQDDYGMKYLTNDLIFYAGEYNLHTVYTLNMSEWYYLVESYDGTTMRTYINGNEVDSYSNSTAISNDASNDIGVGRFIGTSTTRFTGNMDEVKLISEARSAGWIKTSYDNQNSPGTFFSVSITEISNDFPCEAITIPVGSSCSPQVFSNNYATDSGIPLTECNGYTGGDTWFKVTVPASGSLIVKLETAPTPEIPDSFDWLRRPGMGVYSGICSALVHDTCWIDPHPGAPFDTPDISLKDYSPGETIFLRMWEYNNSKGKFSICAFEDNVDPAISCPAAATINCEGDNTPTGTGTATASDNYTPVNDITINYSDVSTYDTDPDVILHYNYTITRTWTATDAAGNTDNCIQVITVQDVSDPTISCLGDFTESVNANCEFTIPDYSGLISYSDNCDNSPTVSQTPTAGTNISGHGTIQEIVLDITDLAGNSSECRFNITLQDLSPPVLVVLRDTIVIIEEGLLEADIDLPLPVFSENCASVTIVNDFNGLSDASGIYPYGTTTVNYTATDDNGNYQVFSQIVQLRYTDEPEYGLIISEGFSPNNDGLNDNFVIMGIEQYSNIVLRVYNIHGTEVYFNNNYENNWDGISNKGLNNGKELPTGNYYYTVVIDNQPVTMKGYIYLRRE